MNERTNATEACPAQFLLIWNMMLGCKPNFCSSKSSSSNKTGTEKQFKRKCIHFRGAIDIGVAVYNADRLPTFHYLLLTQFFFLLPFFYFTFCVPQKKSSNLKTKIHFRLSFCHWRQRQRWKHHQKMRTLFVSTLPHIGTRTHTYTNYIHYSTQTWKIS